MALTLTEIEASLFAAETWQDLVKTTILLAMHAKFNLIGDLQNQPFLRQNFGPINKRFDHRLTIDDVRGVIREMHKLDWIEPCQYKCECCKDKQHSDILDHATAFKMTPLGRSFISRLLPS